MSGEELSSRAFGSPVDATPTGIVSKTTEVVSERIGQAIRGSNVPNVEPTFFPDVRTRKITPASEAGPKIVKPASDTKPGALLDRLKSFFMPSAPNATPETPLLKFDSLSRGPGGTHPSAEKIADAIARLEQSQQFATGTALMSSLTQSVMSSSKRLTQGQ